MIYQIIDKELCTGCEACKSVCNFDAIHMETDEKGFRYPFIDTAKCIQCEGCIKVCGRRLENNNMRKSAYILCDEDEGGREESTSGGVFKELASRFIDNGGYVFGAAFDENLKVYHTAVNSMEELKRLQKSKYVQSDIGDTYKEAKQLLEDGKQVLYSGTPCQIAGLKAYLNKEYSGLLCVDLICQGVPSPEVWREYLSFLGGEDKRVVKFDFRCKDEGWKKLNISYTFDDGQRNVVRFEDDCYMAGFEKTEILRDVCYNCPFRGEHGYSDITLGDCWGYEQITGKRDDDKGMSVLVTNTDKGEELYKLILKNMRQNIQIDYNLMKKYNRNMFFNPSFTSKRLDFYREFKRGNYKSAFIMLLEKDRKDSYISVLSKWLESEIENNNSLDRYMMEHNYRNVVIYGVGMLGRLLIKALSPMENVNIKFCIDNNAGDMDSIHVINKESISEELLEDVDVIVITPVFAKQSIADFLYDNFDGDIVGIDELF